MKCVILFDFDGTIADSFDSFLGIIKKFSHKYGLPELSSEEIQELRSEDPRTIIKRLRIPFYKIPFIARDMKTMQQAHIATVKPFPGMPDVLRRLKNEGCTLGIITSNGYENVMHFLQNHALDIFEYIHTDSSMFGKDKVMAKFLKQQKIREEDAVYVGDEIRDIQACKAVGIRIAAVAWGFNTKESLLRHAPDYLLDNPRDLLPFSRA